MLNFNTIPEAVDFAEQMADSSGGAYQVFEFHTHAWGERRDPITYVAFPEAPPEYHMTEAYRLLSTVEPDAERGANRIVEAYKSISDRASELVDDPELFMSTSKMGELADLMSSLRFYEDKYLKTPSE